MNIKNIISGVGLMFLLALVFTVSVQKVSAASPNILAGQDLSVGSTGQGVVLLQGLMSEFGYLDVPAGVPFGYFGPLTRDAVARYQAAQYVSPTAGYFGPVTKVAMYKQFSPRGWVTLLGWE